MNMDDLKVERIPLFGLNKLLRALWVAKVLARMKALDNKVVGMPIMMVLQDPLSGQICSQEIMSVKHHSMVVGAS